MNKIFEQCFVDGELTPELLKRKAELDQQLDAELDKIDKAGWLTWVAKQRYSTEIQQEYENMWEKELTDAGYIVRPVFESKDTVKFDDWYDELSKVYDSSEKLTEAKYVEANPINLADCRMVQSDVKDIRGELEASACLDYNGELTRVQVRTVIVRDTADGKEFLGKNYGRRIGLPGGGYDADKDNGDILDTAEREAYEEFNFTLSNLKDTGIRVWSHRDDPWVTKHVANEEDRWTGYYTFYVTAEVSGLGDNDKPEEANKWQWLPIDLLSNVNAKLPAFIDTLNEAIHPDKEGRTDLGDISYLCDSLSTLRKILSRMEIQKTYVSEVRYEVGENPNKYNTQRQKQMSLSTSTDLTGHAQRRADKWGFGVILDGAELSKYYDIEQYNHADHKLQDLYISKIVKLKPGVIQDGRLIVGLGEYGNRIISSADNADLRMYELLKRFLNSNTQWLESAMTLQNNYVSKKNSAKWSSHPFGYDKNVGWCDTRFTKLEVDHVEEIYSWPAPASKHAIPIKHIKEFDQELHDTLIDLFKQYTSFDEKEERIWIENNLMNFVQIPPSALTGIILPEYFKDDYEEANPENYHIKWLKQFAQANNLEVLWHEFSVPEYYNIEDKQFNKNNTEGSEATWTATDNAASDPRVILNRAKRSKFTYLHSAQDDAARKAWQKFSPVSVVATAAVKLAVSEYMQDLTADNYEAKYKEALDAAKTYFAETRVPGRLIDASGKLTKKPNEQMEELFDYYCPDPPKDDNNI